MTSRLFAAVALLMSLSMGCSALPAAETVAIAGQVRSECGFDLQAPFLAVVTQASVEATGEKTLRASFTVRPDGWPPASRIQFVFNCTARQSPPERILHQQAHPEAVKSASTIIEEEDAGGRYARHVATERRVRSSNWQGTVAHVDSLVGDGQRSPMTFLLACDRKLARPCFEVHVEPAVRATQGRRLDPIYELMRSVSHAP